MTTTTELSEWFDRGVSQGATHMIIVCDTFDWDDFPVYVEPGEDVHEVEAAERGQPMQKIMEVYNLRLSKQYQLSQFRAFNY